MHDPWVHRSEVYPLAAARYAEPYKRPAPPLVAKLKHQRLKNQGLGAAEDPPRSLFDKYLNPTRSEVIVGLALAAYGYSSHLQNKGTRKYWALGWGLFGMSSPVMAPLVLLGSIAIKNQISSRKKK